MEEEGERKKEIEQIPCRKELEMFLWNGDTLFS